MIANREFLICGGLEAGDAISHRRGGGSAKGPKRAQPVRPLIGT